MPPRYPFDRQSVFAIVAMLVFAAIMGTAWIAMHSFSDDFGVGFAIGAISAAALTFIALGWRRGGFD